MATTVPTAMAAKIANMKLTTTSTQREVGLWADLAGSATDLPS
jgi:hypothetical protein